VAAAVAAAAMPMRLTLWIALLLGADSAVRARHSVIIYKVHSVSDKGQALLTSLCHLTAFFNRQRRYPIVVFTNTPTPGAHVESHRSVVGAANLSFVTTATPDRFLPFPPGMPASVRERVVGICGNGTLSLTTCCATRIGRWSLGYIYMNAWVYLYMADEPAIRRYRHYLFVDSDAYIMKPWAFDPFDLMKEHRLAFIFNQRASSAWEGREVLPIAERHFGPLRGLPWDRCPSCPTDASWIMNPQGRAPVDGWGGWFGGGDLRLLRSRAYRNFAEEVLNTGMSHLFRFDQQFVMTVGVAALAAGRNATRKEALWGDDPIWYLPARGYDTSMFHNWFYDSKVHTLLQNGSGTYMLLGTWGPGSRLRGMVPFPQFAKLAAANRVVGAGFDAPMFSAEDAHHVQSCRARVSSRLDLMRGVSQSPRPASGGTTCRIAPTLAAAGKVTSLHETAHGRQRLRLGSNVTNPWTSRSAVVGPAGAAPTSRPA
jgi:hypothetical protein